MELRMRALRILGFSAFAFVLFAATAFPAITGAVINVDGQPVAGARVSVFAPETTASRVARLVSKTPQPVLIASTTTNAKGAFSLETPKIPVIEVRIEADGYAPDTLRIASDEELGAVALVAAATRTGTITANGKPLAGATVAWNTFITTTDANGKYSMPDPQKWGSRMFVYHPDFAFADDAAVMPNEKKKLDRVLDAGVALTGKVVGDDGKSPLANATIYVDDYPLATSADDGTFTIAHAPKRWEKIEARTATRSGSRVKADGALVIKTAKGATITGMVRDAKSAVPIAGAQVVAMLGGMRMRGSEIASGLTDAKGNYTLPIAPGSYELIVSRPGYSSANASASVSPAQNVQKSFVVTQSGRIVGSVIDEDKRPVSGARVNAQQVTRESGFMGMGAMRGGQGNLAPYSAPDGRFVLRTEADADMQVEAAKRGYPAAKSATLRVAPGERKAGVVLTIPRGQTVTGKVVDQNGKPVAGASVAANEAASGDTGAVMRRVVMGAMRDRGDDLVQTGADGTFTIRLKEGSYDFGFKRDGFAPKTVRSQAVTSATKPIEVTLEPSVEIAGRVTRGGVGIEGVLINAIGESMSSTTSGFDGSFRLTDLAPGQLMLNATKFDEFIQLVRPVTAPATDVLLEIPPGGRISGRVTDKSTGSPVTAFQAGVSAPRGGGGMMIMMPPSMRSFSNDDGTFTLENVPTGQTQLVVSAPGYTTGRVSNLTIEEGKTLADITVTLDTGVKLSGHVTGPDGSALAGVSVRQDMVAGRTMRIGGPAAEGSATTDSNGDYTIEALEAGEKTFVFQRGGYLQTSKTVTLSGKESHLDAQLSAGTRVSGLVVTEGGAPVADVGVRASSASDSGFGGKSTRTDSSGAFTFEGMAPGHYTFTAGKTGYADGILRDFDVVTGGQPRVVLKTGGVISGHVTGLTDKELAQAVVMANNNNGGSSSTVDASGNFRIEGAPTGTVRVNARLQQGFGGSKTSQTKTVEVSAGSSAQVDLEFRSDTVIRGRVTRGGQPLPGAMISFFPRSGRAQTSARTTADGSGSYSVNSLDDAPYDVAVNDLDRNVSFQTTYEVKGSGNFDIDVKVVSLRGRVVDASTGEGIADAHIDLRPSQSQGMGMMMTRGAGTDANGGFVVDSLSTGSYTAVADKEGYGNQVLDVAVTDNGASDLQFKLTPNAGLTLRVVDARNNQLLSAYVSVVDMQGRTVYTPSFRFGGSAEEVKISLAAGTYRATVFAPGYAAQVLTISSPGKQAVGLTPGGSLVVKSKSSTRQRARLVTADGNPYPRGMDPSGLFSIDPSPGATTVTNVAPGMYRLQILDNADHVLTSVDVSVGEGTVQQVEI
jgi:protocatechuate 3,4-dioxygenase beta subunit